MRKRKKSTFAFPNFQAGRRNFEKFTHSRGDLRLCEYYISFQKNYYILRMMYTNILTLKYTRLTSPKCARIVISRAIMLLVNQNRRQAWTTMARRRYKRSGRGRSTARADSRLSPRVVQANVYTHISRVQRDVSFFSLSPSLFRRSQIRSGPFVSPIYVTRRASSGGRAVSEEGEI